jgi:hypothetical protein
MIFLELFTKRDDVLMSRMLYDSDGVFRLHYMLRFYINYIIVILIGTATRVTIWTFSGFRYQLNMKKEYN